jgi:phosphatidate cytidylyltransferase
MSLTAALHDPVFRTYVGLVAELLLLAGLVLAMLQYGFRVPLGGVWKTWQSWLWMAPLAALFVFVGRFAFIAGVTAVGLLAFQEFAHGTELDRDRGICGVVRLGIVAVGISALLNQRVGLTLPAAWLMPIVLVPMVRGQHESDLKRFSLGIFAFVYLGWMFGQLGFLTSSLHPYGNICFILFATEVSDVCAFILGRTFGRHLLAPAISPRKTWEGSLGALLLALALPWLLRFSFPDFDPVELVLTGFIVGFGGQLGDLFSSLLKRKCGLKDWGVAIPGHGGVLDRIDSLIFVAPLFIMMANHYHPGR